MKPIYAFLVALALAAFALAQDAEKPAEKPAEPVLSPEELAARQHQVRERLARIEDTMNRVAKVLARRNPEEAARLRQAWQRSKEDRNLDRITEIENLLKTNDLNGAFENQKQIKAAIQRLLDILLDNDADRKALQDKIKEHERKLELLNKIIEEEREQVQKSEKFADPEKTQQRIAAAKAKLSNLIDRQAKLIDKTKAEKPDPALAELRQQVEKMRADQAKLRGSKDAAAQAKLAEEAKQLAARVAAAAQAKGAKEDAMGRRDPGAQAAAAMKRAAEGMGGASGQMKEGGDASEAQKGAEQDLTEAAEALKRLEKRRAEEERKQLSDEQKRIRDDVERLRQELEKLEKGAEGSDSGAGALGQAQGDMRNAEGRLSKGGKNGRQDAVPHEEDAKEEMERAYKKLEKFEKEMKKLSKLPDYEKLAKEQDGTTEKTEELLKKMKGGEQGADGEGGEATPGEGGVQGAKRAMQRASRNMRSRSARSANSDQKEALERLEKAREELEEALRQLREEEQLMLLDALERRLTTMLQKQRKLLTDTIALSIRLDESEQEGRKPPRADVDQSRQIGEGEAGLAVDADKVHEILLEEGSSVVIPDVVADMKLDLEGLAKRLRDLKAGAYTQQIQKDVIVTLRELIEIIQQERERKQGGGEGNGDGGESDQPESLLPNSAELKMLRALQLRVNKRTRTFDRLREQDETERARISEKQGSVGTLTRTMADKLNQEEE